MHGSFTEYAFFAFFAVAIIFIIISWIQGKKRTAGMAALAPSIGFSFEGDDWSDPSRAPRLRMPLFDRGHDGRFSNIITGQFGAYVTSVFDYSFTTGAGKNSHTLTQTVVSFTQDLWLPVFQLRPEHLMDRVADAFTHKDIDFDSNPDFSHRFLLRGDESDKIRELFTPALLTFFEGLPSSSKWQIEGDGYTLVLYSYDKTVNVAEIRPFLEQTAGMAATFLSSCGLAKHS